jgi:hypothetical protein
MSTFPSAVALRSLSSTAILSSAIVVLLRVVGSSVQRREDDAMADSVVSQFRLLHHHLGHDRSRLVGTGGCKR